MSRVGLGCGWCNLGVVTQKLTHSNSFIHSFVHLLTLLIHSFTHSPTHSFYSLIHSTNYYLIHSLYPFTNRQLAALIHPTQSLYSLIHPLAHPFPIHWNLQNVYTLFGSLRHWINAIVYSLSVDLNVPQMHGLRYGYFSLWKLRWLSKFRGSMLMFGRAGPLWPPSFRYVDRRPVCKNSPLRHYCVSVATQSV